MVRVQCSPTQFWPTLEPTFYLFPAGKGFSLPPECKRMRLFRYVPRKWVKLIAITLLCVVITGTLMVLQGGSILYFWANSSKQSTHQLEALIPIESNKKVERPFHSPQQRENRALPPVIAQAREGHTTAPRCKAKSPRILFFIRVPKCASTSFVDLLHSLAIKLPFDFIFNPSGAYDWDDKTARKVVQNVQSKGGDTPVVYARHFYYTDFKRYGLIDYEYITVIREPLARFVSSYLYYHFSSKPQIQRMLKPGDKNESFLECITRKHNGCAHNWLTKYFCGHRRFCSSGSKEALAVAMENMRHKFAVVGLLEKMETTLRVFRKILPGYFGAVELQIPGSNRNEQSMALSQEEREAAREANSADIKLYAYAQELLRTINQSCYS